MARQKGRPKKAIVQEKNIGFFVTFAQWEIIQCKAEQAHVNISDYMRQVAVNSEVKAKWTSEEREMVKKLIGMSVDLHELAMAARGQGSAITAESFHSYRDGIDEIIKKLCHDR